MTSELNICPFCGGEAHFEVDTDGSFMLEVEHEPWCFLTSMDTRHWYYCETVEEAAQDWNQRAERTCKYDYFQEAKEAHWLDKVWLQGYHVLECGHRVPGDYFECPKYCCVCGAKVVE